MTAMRHVYFVSVLVIRPAGDRHEVLMGKRVAGKYLGGTWQLIAGGIEPGEAAWRAAVREVMEETSLTIERLWRLPRLTQFYSPVLEALCFAPMFAALVARDAVAVCNPEHTELEWLTFDQAAQRMMWPADRAALAEADTLILQSSPAEEQLRIPIHSTGTLGEG